MRKIAIIFIISFGFALQSSAQATDDAGLWCTFNLEKNINQKFGLFLTEEYRIKENFSQNNLFYTDLGVSYKPADFLKISVSYRSIQKFRDDNTISFRNRGTLDVVLKKKFGKITLSFRQRLQSEYQDIYTSELGSIPEWYTRSLIKLKYDFEKPITPYLSTEFRYQINNPTEVDVNNLWHRTRYQVGFDYKKSDRNSFGVYYMLQREWDVSAPQNLYIIGLEYTLTL